MAEQNPAQRERQFGSGVAESAYRHVIENAISAIDQLPANREEALIYLMEEWLPFAKSCQRAWQG